MSTGYRRGAKPFLLSPEGFHSVFEDTKEGQGGAMGATKGGTGAIRGAMWRNGGRFASCGAAVWLQPWQKGKKS